MRTKLQLLAAMSLLTVGSMMGQYSYFPFDTDAKDANKKNSMYSFRRWNRICR